MSQLAVVVALVLLIELVAYSYHIEKEAEEKQKKELIELREKVKELEKK